jgi:nucleoside-diphosphate-sugar epimerase
MKILVTGDTGYIGSVALPMMQNKGFEVVGLDSDLFSNCLFDTPQEVTAHKKKDIRDLTVDDLRGFDAVCHLAALSNDPLGNLDPNLTYDINHRASVELASKAKAAGVKRFVFSSSCSTYGAAGDKPVTEESEFNPVTPYGRSKVLVENDVRKLASEDFSPVFLRNATAYGFSPRMRFDLVLNNLTAWAVATGRVFIKSDGTPWRPIVHIEDISRAFIAALIASKERIHNESFNIGRDDENYQIRDIAEIVKQVVPNTTVEIAADGEPDKRSYRVDFGKVQRQLPEFQPQWTARKGAEQLYEAYSRIGVSVDDFEGPRFRRIDTIKKMMSEGLIDQTLRWKKIKTESF